MIKKLTLRIFCALVAVAVQATAFAGQIGVQITLNSAPANAVSCTSKSGVSISAASVRVTCTSNLYVNIVQLITSRESTSPVAGKFVTGFGQARSIIFSGLNSGQIDDAVAQEDQGWSLEGRIYAGNATPEQAKQLARWRLRNDEGTLTALRVVDDNGHPATVEMLVSF